MARNLRPGTEWVPAVVVERLGPLTYLVETSEHLIWKRHIDLLRELSLSRSLSQSQELEESEPEVPVETPNSEVLPFPLPAPEPASVSLPEIADSDPVTEHSELVSRQHPHQHPSLQEPPLLLLLVLKDVIHPETVTLLIVMVRGLNLSRKEV